MAADAKAHSVAMYMRALFRHKLAFVTAKQSIPGQPKAPNIMSRLMERACDAAVTAITAALLNTGTVQERWAV